MPVAVATEQAPLAPEPLKNGVSVKVAEAPPRGAKDTGSVTVSNGTTQRNGNRSEPSRLQVQHRPAKNIHAIRRKVLAEIDDMTEQHFHDIESHKKYINEERLVRMPVRGSDWDRVLTAAIFFAEQLDDFTKNVDSFVDESYFVRDTILGCCHVLLEVYRRVPLSQQFLQYADLHQLGFEQAQALEATFNALYELGAHLSRVTRLQRHFLSSSAIRTRVADMFNGIAWLTADIALWYRKLIPLVCCEPITVDFDAHYGDRITSIFDMYEEIINDMWCHQLENEKDLAMDFATLRQNMIAGADSMKSVLYSRVAERRGRAVDTCEWIMRDVGDFLSGKEQILTVTGGGGCGKSMLATWVRERLEKPVGLRKFETLSFSFGTYPDQFPC